MLLCTLVLTGAFYALSSHYFKEIYTASQYRSLTNALNAAGQVFQRYREGNLTRRELQSALNPTIKDDTFFYMLLDENRQVLAYTETAAPYFAGSTLPELLDSLNGAETAAMRSQTGGATALLMGQKVGGGYVLAGRPMQTYSSTFVSFRTRLLISMGAVKIFISLYLTETPSCTEIFRSVCSLPYDSVSVA